ncbi:hypothetical protein EON81_11885 [bacterium]|nr:MAG: hypothetical protein EON81_11885 [bacterium]
MGLMLVSALVFGQSVYGQTTFAPPDVPRNHWAFHAVDDLFKAGLLKGYPGKATPDLEYPKVEFDRSWLEKTLKSWKENGLMVGYPEGHRRYPSKEISRYELAVMTHATYVNVNNHLAQWGSTGLPANTATEVVRALAMVRKELVELNVGMEESLAELNRNLKFSQRRFNSP